MYWWTKKITYVLVDKNAGVPEENLHGTENTPKKPNPRQTSSSFPNYFRVAGRQEL